LLLHFAASRAGISLVKHASSAHRARVQGKRPLHRYSIYYTMVNIGGAAGPYLAGWAHDRFGVENVFRLSALSVFAMFFVVLIFFPRAAQAGDARHPPSRR